MPNLCTKRVLVVSKPLGGPWNDGSKNLARDVVGAIRARGRYAPCGFVSRGSGEIGIAVPDRTVSVRTAARMVAKLAFDRTAALWHFFFAPNARTSSVAGALCAMRRVPTVQTIASAPLREARLGDLAFGDRVVALSRATHRRALEEGVPAHRLVLVPTATRAPEPPSEAAVAEVRRAHELASGALVVCFPGDLEHGRGAELVIDACAAARCRGDLVLVMACRAKTSNGTARQQALAARAAARGVAIRWVGETPAIHALLAASDVVALPTDTLYAKVDHPLVLLEAMHLGRPVLVTEGTSAFELAEDGGAVGARFDAEDVAARLDALAGDHALRAEAGAKASAHARVRSVEAMARAYESLYDELTR